MVCSVGDSIQGVGQTGIPAAGSVATATGVGSCCQGGLKPASRSGRVESGRLHIIIRRDGKRKLLVVPAGSVEETSMKFPYRQCIRILAVFAALAALRPAIAQRPVDADWTANAKIENLQVASDGQLGAAQGVSFGKIACTSTATSTRPSRGSALFANTRST